MLKQFIIGVLSSVAAHRLFPPPTNNGQSRGGGCILRLFATLIVLGLFIALLCWAVGYGIVVAPTYTLLALYAGLKFLAANGFIALDKLFYPGFDVPAVAAWAFWGLIGGTAIQGCREMRSHGRKGMGTLAALAPILLLGLNGIIKDIDMPKPQVTKTTTTVEQNTSGSETKTTKRTETTPAGTKQIVQMEPVIVTPEQVTAPSPTTTGQNTDTTTTTVPIIKDIDMPKPQVTKTTTTVEQNTSGSETKTTKRTETTPAGTKQIVQMEPVIVTPEQVTAPSPPTKPSTPGPTTPGQNTDTTTTTVPLNMVLIPAGKFQMGSGREH